MGNYLATSVLGNLSKVKKILYAQITTLLLQFFESISKDLEKYTTLTHSARGRRDNVVATSFCPPKRRRRYVSNKTPNDFSVERIQDISVVRLQSVIKERHDNVLRVRNNDVPLVRLHNVSN